MEEISVAKLKEDKKRNSTLMSLKYFVTLPKSV